MQPLYDHSYYFISTFMRDHVDHHARALGLRYWPVRLPLRVHGLVHRTNPDLHLFYANPDPGGKFNADPGSSATRLSYLQLLINIVNFSLQYL
jgi:hypothetical protein